MMEEEVELVLCVVYAASTLPSETVNQAAWAIPSVFSKASLESAFSRVELLSPTADAGWARPVIRQSAVAAASTPFAMVEIVLLILECLSAAT
ncbi:hypothetical protein BMIN_1198 [Bifidobacterium minimum]|uniref:Uncharacterized protein n=1 Tax=Bifidobacterium minimum TaxID=1693 RepID=A0A087BT09_9BIFI|nr:hypothetical protein BMIN_1198 [Bifidobacterium minimum]